MKKMHIQSFLAIGILASLWFACSRDGKIDETTKNQLIGKWEIKEAYRNGSLAESLEDLYFEFDESGQMSTNILGATTKTDYLFEGDSIVQSAGENGIEVTYNVEGITDTSLVLLTVLRRYNFKFDLRKSTGAEELQ